MLCAERQPSGEDRARVTGATLTTSMSSRILIQANPSISLLPHLGPSLQWQSADTKWKTAFPKYILYFGLWSAAQLRSDLMQLRIRSAPSLSCHSRRSC